MGRFLLPCLCIFCFPSADLHLPVAQTHSVHPLYLLLFSGASHVCACAFRVTREPRYVTWPWLQKIHRAKKIEGGKFGEFPHKTRAGVRQKKKRHTISGTLGLSSQFSTRPTAPPLPTPSPTPPSLSLPTPLLMPLGSGGCSRRLIPPPQVGVGFQEVPLMTPTRCAKR